MSLRIPALAVTLLIGLVACTGGEDQSAAPVTSASRAVPSSAALSSAAPSPVTSSPVASGTLAASASPDSTTATSKGFGQTTTFADQSAITVQAPVSGTVNGADAALLKVTVTNRSGEQVPMQFWFFQASVEGKPVAALTDASQKIGQPKGMLAAGASSSFTLAYPWKPGQKLQLTVNWRDSYGYTYSA